jgi:hypothetical protein
LIPTCDHPRIAILEIQIPQEGTGAHDTESYRQLLGLEKPGFVEVRKGSVAIDLEAVRRDDRLDGTIVAGIDGGH